MDGGRPVAFVETSEEKYWENVSLNDRFTEAESI